MKEKKEPIKFDMIFVRLSEDTYDVRVFYFLEGGKENRQTMYLLFSSLWSISAKRKLEWILNKVGGKKIDVLHFDLNIHGEYIYFLNYLFMIQEFLCENLVIYYTRR